MSTYQGNIIRQKAQTEVVFKLDIPTILYHPREDPVGNLYVCSQMGEIIKFTEKGQFETLLSFPGQPTCVAFGSMEGLSFSELDSKKEKNENDSSNSLISKPKEQEEEKFKESLIYADLANSIIYFMKPNHDKEYLAKEYEGCPLKGPTSIAVNIEEQSIFFCDAGYFESTSIGRPNGSIYLVQLSNQKMITPIVYNCLSYPADIFYDDNLYVGYVAETFTNRVLRITRTAEKYQTSVFYTFQGRIGPTAIASDDAGNVYVSRYEYQNKEGDVDGIISVINKDGNLVGELIIPKMPEITGLFIPKKEEFKDNRSLMYLYFTEKHFSGVQRIKIGSFISEIEKALDKIY